MIETELDFHHQELNVQAVSRVADRLTERGSEEIRKSQRNLKIECRYNLVSSLPSGNKNLAIALENWARSAINFALKSYVPDLNLTFPISRFPKLVSNYFGHDCVRKQLSLVNLVQTPWNINFLQILVSLKLLTWLKFILRAN